MDFRPVGHVIGLLLLALAAGMLAPAVVDLWAGNSDWQAFVVSAVLTALVGGALALGFLSGRSDRLQIDQSLLFLVLAWVVIPLFGALPFMIGGAQARMVDAVFEAVSGVTTTGSTVFVQLETLPPGILLWRAILQWLGGIGVIVFAVVFLPYLKIGGMQLFRVEGLEGEGSSLRRTGEIALNTFGAYLTLTALCAFAYGATGMRAFDAACHAMTTIATGGFANYDASFAEFGARTQYVAIVFMLLSALPFLLYVDTLRSLNARRAGGRTAPLIHRDPQVRGFLAVVAVVTVLLIATRASVSPAPTEAIVREALFNGVSIITGTGYASANYTEWGAFAVIVFFAIGLIGGCSGSTCCSIKIFRYQVLSAVVLTELRKLRRPNAVIVARFGGKPIGGDIAASVMIFFCVFMLTLIALTLALAWIGLDLETAISGAATALANIGPGLGDTIGPVGNFSTLPDAAKIVLIIGMLLGRLELLAVFALLAPSFWRR